ncbi:glycosyltransferase [Tundrisphaera lichenicola]|uniref:glycosyltransferase n=1 Tax=Tundrisphaera lichenicola TaxID=2029860 RepID=UPI003EBD8B71
MTPTQRTILGIYAALIAIWPIRHLVLSWAFPKLDYLGPDSGRFEAPDPPLVSAIIPAKDEEATIAECLASVQAQSYPNLEILIVDDRSTDRTAEIVRSLAEADPRVRLISIEDLPPGWTGKTHGLHVASGRALGEWFWFLDADTRHEPDSLAIVLEYARSHDAAMASLLPEMRCESFWESVAQPLLGVVLMQSYPLFWANDPSKKLAFANGQYILIRRDAYEAAGGHEGVRDKFVEDIYLAKAVKSLGYSSRTAIAHGIGSTRMYTSLPQFIRGWSRILYDALGRNPWRLLIQGLDPLFFSQTAHVALVASLVMLATGRPAGMFPIWLLGMSVIHHLLAYTCLKRLYVLSVPRTRHVAWYPLAGLVLDVILYRAIRMCLTGQVTWRGTAYREEASPASRT